MQVERDRRRLSGDALIDVDLTDDEGLEAHLVADTSYADQPPLLAVGLSDDTLQILRKELAQIREMLVEPL